MITLKKGMEDLITDIFIACASEELDNNDIKGAIKKLEKLLADYKGLGQWYQNVFGKEEPVYLHTILINPVMLYIYFKSVLNVNYFDYISNSDADPIYIIYAALSRFSEFIDINGEQELQIVIPQNLNCDIILWANNFTPSNIPPIVITTNENESVWKVHTRCKGALGSINGGVKIVLPRSIKSIARHAITGQGVDVYYYPVNGKPNFKTDLADKPFFKKHLKPITEEWFYEFKT